MRNQQVNIYQLFKREFGEKENNFLELSFTYLLKCFYFPLYYRPEYFQEQNKEADEEGIKINNYSKYYNNYLYDNIFSKEFIRGAIEFMPNQPTLNKITEAEVEQLKKAWDLLPKEWKEKRPWYPLSYCDLALDNCLIEVKWADSLEIKEEVIWKLTDCIFDYDFPTIKKIGVYFAQQGKLFICANWGCPSDITAQDFHEEPTIREKEPREKRITPNF